MSAGEPVRLPADRRRVPFQVRQVAHHRGELVPAAAVAPLAAVTGTGVAAVLLAGLVALLARYSGQSTVVIEVTATDGCPPCLVDLAVAADESFAALVGHVAGQAERAGVRPGDQVRWGTADLGVRLVPGDRLGVDVDYDANVFVPDTVRRLVRHYATLLSGGLAEPEWPVARLPLLSATEAATMLIDWNDTRVELPTGEQTIHGAFARQAREHPDRVAVTDGTAGLTFAEVDSAANHLAHRLRALGVVRGVRVGLCLHRCADFLVTVLAVLKAGGAYVPLDPAYPAARLDTMVRDAACAVVVTSADLAAKLESVPVPLMFRPTSVSTMDGTAPDDGGVGPDDLCYLIYTSGSTGRPKGIALRHAGVLNNLLDLNTRFGVGPGDSVLALSSLSFDMSVYEFLGVTIAGGTVVIPERTRAKNPSHWVDLIARHGVTVWNSAPALLELLVGQAERAGRDLTSLRLALLGGDWISTTLPDRLRVHAPRLRFISLGGATEASIHSTIYEVSRTDPDWVSIPYGRPMANQRVYVLDPARLPVPVGVAGELYLAGDGLARGYVGDEALTAAKFVEWSYGPVVGERLYRTGDLARYGPDGQLELLGRIDFQVKIRGVRIETGEVEAVLLRHPGVQACAVTACGTTDTARRLVAYTVPCPGSEFTTAALREHVMALLPAALVPARFVVLDALPLSPNGKVDRQALPAPLDDRRHDVSAPGDIDLPRDLWERRVAEAWQQILGGPRIGRDSDFFALGGDSFAAMRIVQCIDPQLPVTELFASPTVKGLAARLRERAGSA